MCSAATSLGKHCRGATTKTPQTVAVAQRNFMSSLPHRTSELAAYRRFGCGTATNAATHKTYFACLFADAGSATFDPKPTPTPTPKPTDRDARADAHARRPRRLPSAEPDTDSHAEANGRAHPCPTSAPTPSTRAMVPACSGVNLRTGTSTTTTVKARLSSGTLTVTGTRAGSSLEHRLRRPKAGSGWYRVSHVNGKPVSSLYGVAVLYAATGVLRAAPAPAPTPKPTPKPTPTPRPRRSRAPRPRRRRPPGA